MVSQSRPEPMNASQSHSKVKATLTLSDLVYVAGGLISGKMQVESRADLDCSLGIGVMMVELYAVQEIDSGELSATSTFIHSRRLFQGPGLPLSNAVYSDHVPETGESPLPAHHYPARRGQTTFFFQFPIPASSPSSIEFGPASIRYEIRASVSVAWEGEKCLVTDVRQVKVVESWDPANAILSPQAVVITERGKIWAQATLTNVVVGGESACVELQLRNHTQRWTSGITVTLTRDLHFSQSFLTGKSLPNISDVCTQVEFRGPEYSVPPGVEGIATLVIDIPRHSRGVQGGLRTDDNGKDTEAFFEVRCALRLRIDMPPESEDTVVVLPLIIYHSLAVPEISTPSPHLTPSYPCTAPASPRPLPPSPGTALIPLYTGNQMQEYDPPWTPSSARPISNYLLNQQVERESHNRQNIPYSYAPLVTRPISAGPPSQILYPTTGLPISFTPAPRSLPPPPTHMPYIYPRVPTETTETIGVYTNSNHIGVTAASPTSQNIHLAVHQPPVSLSPQYCYSSQSCSHDQPRTPRGVCPLLIQIPPLPNPHDSQGFLHSPRPVPSPKHSFYGSVPKSDSVSELERIADEVGKQTSNLSLDLPGCSAGVVGRGPRDHGADLKLDLSVDKTLPPTPLPSRKDRAHLAQHPHVDTLFTTEEAMHNHSTFPSSTDQIPPAPPTPPIAAITPIKFPKAPTELSGLGANLGKDVPPESGLDVLERRLLAEVGTRKFETDERPHVRSVVQPISIPPGGPSLDTVNDSAISSLTLADREGILRETPEREQEQDRDSDERTQHNGGGGHSPSEDARTHKGKSSRKLGKSKHSEEDLERAGRRRERKKVKDDQGRKLRQEAKGRVAAWLGEIDTSIPPMTDDPTLFISPVASHFVPITESASFGPAPAEMTSNKVEERPGGGISADKDVSASPNPRSSGFVTISTLNAVVDSSGGEASSFKPSPRRSSLNDIRQGPPSLSNRPPLSRLPGAAVKPSEPLSTLARAQTSQPQPPLPIRPAHLFSGRLPRFSSKPVDPEVKYDVRSARGGRGGKVAQVASLWAAKANAGANANAKTRDAASTPASASKPPKLPPSLPALRKPVPSVPKRSPTSARSPYAGPGGGGTLAGLNRTGVGGETRTDMGLGAGLGTREVSKPSKATTVPAVLSSSHAVPMLSSTASLACVKAPGPGLGQGRTLPPMISETMSDLRNVSKTPGGVKPGAGTGASNASGGQGRPLGDLAFGQARLRDLIKKYQG